MPRPSPPRYCASTLSRYAQRVTAAIGLPARPAAWPVANEAQMDMIEALYQCAITPEEESRHARAANGKDHGLWPPAILTATIK